MSKGAITGIFRDGDPQDSGSPIPYVEASLVDGARTERCRYYGNPPPPLSICEFTDTGGGEWFCEGARDYDLRRVLHEDFTTCSTVTVSGTAVAADTPWGTFLSGTGSRVDALASSGLGVCRLTAGAAAARSALMFKTVDHIIPSAADAIWFSTRIQLGTSAASIDAIVGLADGSGVADYVYARVITSLSQLWALHTLKDGVSSGTVTATTAAVDGYHNFDVILVPGVYAALWIDGDGPYVVTTNVPAGTDPLTVFLWVTSAAAATKTLDVDYFTLTAINGDLAHPETHPLLV